MEKPSGSNRDPELRVWDEEVCATVPTTSLDRDALDAGSGRESARHHAPGHLLPRPLHDVGHHA